MIDLKKFRTDKGITQIQAGEMFSVTQSAVAKAEKEFTVPERWVDILKDKYGDLSEYTTWERSEENDKRLIPYYDDVVATASSKDITVGSQTNGSPLYINVGDLLPGTEIAIKIAGNSMLTGYPAGCLIGIRRILDIDEIDYGNVYVVETKENRFVKRLFKGSVEHKVQLYSDNKETFSDGPRKGMYMYEPFELHLSKIKRLFKVVGLVKSSDHSKIPEFL